MKATQTLAALAALALVALIYGCIYAYGEHQFGLGEQAERAEWLGREVTELTMANGRIKALEELARDKEYRHSLDMADVSATYQKDLKHEKETHSRDVADLRAGTLRLRVQLARSQGTGGSSTGEAGPGPGRCDGETSAELSVEASEFLVGLASEADEVVHQLTACQAVVIADRKQQGEQ